MVGETGFVNSLSQRIFFHFAYATRLAEIPFLLIAIWYGLEHS